MNLNSYLCYYADFLPEEDGFNVIVSHAPFPAEVLITDEWITCGDNFEDAVDMARDLIITIAESFVLKKQQFPVNTEKQDGQVEIKLPYHVALKISLRRIMIENNIKPVDIAKNIGISRQSVNQILNLRKKTNIDILAEMFRVVNHPLRIEF